MATVSKNPPLRALFLPWFATGHIIPIVDFARLLAAHNVHCTIALTPANVPLVKSTAENSSKSGLRIDIVTFPFPSEESGLPPGVENGTTVPIPEGYKLNLATAHARAAIVDLIKSQRPDAIVCDPHFAYVSQTAAELGIPYVTFHPVGMFPCCIIGALFSDRHHLSAASDTEPFPVPGLPHKIELVRSELPDFLRNATEFEVDGVKTAARTFGEVVNSFREMEGEYAEFYEKNTGERTWLVGPVSLATCGDEKDQAVRGGGTGHEKCLKWLDTMGPGSVVYLCFGSWCHFDQEQITELASGLESCGHPFLWVVREEKDALPEGFEGRVEGRGLVVRGWVPQVAVLGHPSVGGFVCHCGWNSLLEGVSAGLPMVTWPLFIEQFINEKLVTDVLRTGVKNWGGFRSTLLEEKVAVKGVDVDKAIRMIMDAGEEADGMRLRAKEYGNKARMAVKEGGSSYTDLDDFVVKIKAALNKN